MKKLNKISALATILGTAIAFAAYLNASPQITNNNNHNNGTVINQPNGPVTINNGSNSGRQKLVTTSDGSGVWLLKEPDFMAANALSKQPIHVERLTNGTELRLLETTETKVDWVTVPWAKVQTIGGHQKGYTGWIPMHNIAYK
ncbi:hypothetical protein AB4452_06660 [Vibrio lentus]